MRPIAFHEIKNLHEYEKERESRRSRIIALKRNRRVSVGEHLTFLFENRDTVLYQIQEMCRTERIVEDDKVREEIAAYSALLPAEGELSATLFIEIPELVRMSQEEVRRAMNRFQGIDEEGIFLALGERIRIPARFEGGHGKEEKMAAVHYLRFPVPPDGRAALADPARKVSLLVDHPHYKAQRELPPAVRIELLEDLS